MTWYYNVTQQQLAKFSPFTTSSITVVSSELKVETEKGKFLVSIRPINQVAKIKKN